MSELKHLLPVLLLISSVVHAEADPSAVYCLDMGYNYVIMHTLEGDKGICQFPDGSYTEAWRFLRGEERQEFNWCEMNGYEWKASSSTGCPGYFMGSCVLCIINGTGTEASALASEYPLPSFVEEIDRKNKISSAETLSGSISMGENDGSLLTYAAIVVMIILLVFFFRKHLFSRKSNIK